MSNNIGATTTWSKNLGDPAKHLYADGKSWSWSKWSNGDEHTGFEFSGHQLEHLNQLIIQMLNFVVVELFFPSSKIYYTSLSISIGGFKTQSNIIDKAWERGFVLGSDLPQSMYIYII